jgi:hypothetical protein
VASEAGEVASEFANSKGVGKAVGASQTLTGESLARVSGVSLQVANHVRAKKVAQPGTL